MPAPGLPCAVSSTCVVSAPIIPSAASLRSGRSARPLAGIDYRARPARTGTDRQIVDVGHPQGNLADVGRCGERGLAHPVQAVLHRGAVGGGVHPQQRLPDRVCHRIIAAVVVAALVERTAPEPPGRRHAGGQDAVGGRRQRGVLVLWIVDESRARGLHDREVLEAGLDFSRRPGHGRAGEGRSALRPHEAVLVLAAVDPHAAPDRFLDPDTRFRNVRIAVQEALPEGQGERLVGRAQVPERQHVDQVLHGVGGNDRRVVGVRIRSRELAVKDDGDAALSHLVTIPVALHAQHAHVRLSVALSNECHECS